MLNKYVLIFLFSVFIASCAQILLKVSANNNHPSFIKEYFNPYVMMAYLVMFASTILTVIAYRGVELKMGPILESTGYIFVLFFSSLFLEEKISANKVIGTALIIFGIFVFGI